MKTTWIEHALLTLVFDEKYVKKHEKSCFFDIFHQNLVSVRHILFSGFLKISQNVKYQSLDCFGSNHDKMLKKHENSCFFAFFVMITTDTVQSLMISLFWDLFRIWMHKYASQKLEVMIFWWKNRKKSWFFAIFHQKSSSLSFSLAYL